MAVGGSRAYLWKLDPLSDAFMMKVSEFCYRARLVCRWLTVFLGRNVLGFQTPQYLGRQSLCLLENNLYPRKSPVHLLRLKFLPNDSILSQRGVGVSPDLLIPGPDSGTYFPNAKHSRVMFCPSKAVVSGNLTLMSAGYFLIGPGREHETAAVNRCEVAHLDGRGQSVVVAE